jgi:carboxymethylenebutenolidase
MSAERIELPGSRPGAGGLLTLHSSPPRPAVVLLPAVAGTNDYIVDLARRLASAGYVTLALDYYDGGGPPPLGTPTEVAAAVAAIEDRRVIADAIAAGRFLSNHPNVQDGRVALMGFCIGGSMALLTAAAEDQPFRGVVVYYGLLRYGSTSEAKPVSPLDVAGELRCPLVAHFGEDDHLVAVDDVLELRKRTASRPAEVFTYPGAGHAFHEDFRPDVYRPVASTVSWTRTMAFVDWYLSR